MVHANLQWMKKNGLKEIRKEVVPDLRKLVIQQNLADFGAALSEFTTKWSSVSSAYIGYFLKTWTQGIPAARWAMFGRPKDAQTGDNVIEGWHNRFERTSYSGTRQRRFSYESAGLCRCRHRRRQAAYGSAQQNATQAAQTWASIGGAVGGTATAALGAGK